MSAPAEMDALPFGEFLAVLRARGFTITLEHHLRLARLLECTGPSIEPARLKGLLAPIFATGPQEQEEFHAAFESYFHALLLPAGDAGHDRQAAEIQQPVPRRRPWWHIGIIVVALVVFVVLLWRGWDLWKPLTPDWRGWSKAPAKATPVTPGIPSEPTSNVLTPADSQTHLAPATTPNTPDVTSPDATKSSGKQTADFFRVHRVLLRGLVVALALMGFAAGEWWQWRRRELLIQRSRKRRPPLTWQIRVRAPLIREFHRQPFYTAARALRLRQAGDTDHLDLPRTLLATIRHGGLPRLVYRRGSRVPEYLILIRRTTPGDHQAAYFDHLVEALAGEGVFVARYFYRGDPRVCWDERGSYPLADLRRLHSDHRLLLFDTGTGLLDPVTGAPAAWVSLLLEWHQRALFTPVPSRRWGWREETLEALLPVLPATLEALAAAPDLLEHGPADAGSRAWHDDAPSVPKAGKTPSVKVLRSYLGEAAFEWLCACAIYPELQWCLTLFLGAQLPHSNRVLSEATLLRLIRLPWFREGAMPEELRARLLGELPMERQFVFRRALVEALETNPPPRGSHAADSREIDIAIQRRWMGRTDRTIETKPSAKVLPFGDQTRDYAELQLHERTGGSPLDLLLPGRLRVGFREKAFAPLSIRPAIRFFIAILLALSAWLGIGWLAGYAPLSSNAVATNIATLKPTPPVPASVPTPTPPPPWQEPVRAAVATAAQFEKENKWARALDTYLDVFKKYPEARVGKNYLESLLDRLRARPSPITMDEFQAMRPQITDAARMGILSAMLLLGDNLWLTEQKQAFEWYSKAASEGSATAETALGFMVSHGVGTDSPDPGKAFEYFKWAADKGDAGGKFALGLCYRTGAGVPRDPGRAIELLREAAATGDTRAMTTLGDMYVHGEGVTGNKKEFLKEAVDLFTNAMERGNLNATANLGALYIRGLGVPKNPEKAAGIFAAGAKIEETLTPAAQAGYNGCMQFYAQCLESGTGVEPNIEEAKSWYIKAAKAGNQKALDWCKAHEIPVGVGN